MQWNSRNPQRKSSIGFSGKTSDAIIKHLKLLEETLRPFGAEKLTGRTEYKLRVGNYRGCL